MKLSNHFSRGGIATLGIQSITENENFLLTDSGLKQMNRLKISSYGRRKVKGKSKVKPKKFGLGNASGVVSKIEIMSPDQESGALKSFNFDENVVDQKSRMGDIDQKPGRSKSGHRPGVGGFLVKGRGAAARKFAGRSSKVTGRKKDRQIVGISRSQPGRQQV
jgi:hypothetical protein